MEQLEAEETPAGIEPNQHGVKTDENLSNT